MNLWVHRENPANRVKPAISVRISCQWSEVQSILGYLSNTAMHSGMPCKHSSLPEFNPHDWGEFLSLTSHVSFIVSPLISGFYSYFYRTQHSLLYNSAKMHLYLPSTEHYFPNNSNATGFTTDVNIYQNIPKC